jgi:hypothetical protein
VSALRAITGWASGEARLLAHGLRDRRMWAALLAGLLIWTLAYQLPAGHTLHIGGDPWTRLRGYDAPFLTGFNASEPEQRGVEWHTLGKPPYRWTEESAEVLLPGLGGGDWRIDVTAASGRPDGAAVESQWRIGDGPPVTLSIAATPQVHRLIGRAVGGDVRLRIEAPLLEAPGDPRRLGIVLHRLEARPLDGGPRAPAPATLGLLALTLGGLMALARRVHGPGDPGGHVGPPLLVGAAAIGVTAYLLALHRIDLTVFLPLLTALVWICYPLAALLTPTLRAAALALGVASGESERSAAALTATAAFGVRMAGMLHPYAIFSDTRLHANNLLGVALGGMFFTEGLPCEAGGGQSPYPPGPYLTLLPGALLAGGDGALRQLLMQGGVALVESCSAALIWLLLRAAGFGRRAALASAALYVAAPPLLRSYSVGEMANLFAQALLLPLLLLLVVAGATHAGRRTAALCGALLTLVLLGHTGATISTAALLAAWLPLSALGRLVAGDRRPTNDDRQTTNDHHRPQPFPPHARPPATGDHGGSGWEQPPTPDGRRVRGGRIAWPIVLAGIVAVGAAGLLYYSAFLGLFETRRELAAAQVGLPLEQRCPPDRPLGDKLSRWVVGQVVSPEPALAAPLLVGGVVGTTLALRAERSGGRRWLSRSAALGVTLLACWLGMLLSLGTLVTSDQAVRWQPFLFPALCVGAGIALAGWWRRGRAGRWTALAALAYLLWYGLADLVRQVADYLH